MGDTPFVNMVRRASTKVLLEPGARSSRGKGKPQLTSFVQGSPAVARYRPPVPAAGTRLHLCQSKRPRRDVLLRGVFLSLIRDLISAKGISAKNPSRAHEWSAESSTSSCAFRAAARSRSWLSIIPELERAFSSPPSRNRCAHPDRRPVPPRPGSRPRG